MTDSPAPAPVPFFFGEAPSNSRIVSTYKSPLEDILTDLKRKHVVAAAAAASTGAMSSLNATGSWNLQQQQRESKKRSTDRRSEREDLSHRQPQHAQALLRRTPHLRHLSSATAEPSHPFLPFIRPESSQTPTLVDYRTALIRDQANHQAASELTSFLWVLAHEMSLDVFGQVESAVFTKIFQLVHSPHTRMAGVAALNALIEAPSADEEKKAIKFANNLSNGLRLSGDYEFWSSVSRALGRMAQRATNVDFVESEIIRALEWMGTDRSDRRLAATLTLKELAIYAPAAFYSKTSDVTGSNEFLDHIFGVLSDLQPIVRACAADALSQCLKILVDRHHTSLTALLCQVHFHLMEGLDQTSDSAQKKPSQMQKTMAEAKQHGLLLVVACMLEYTRDFMLPRFDEVCEAVLKFTNHPKALIRLEVIRLIPRLARRCPGVFGRRYLEASLVFLVNSASNSTAPRAGVDVRPSAFCSIGHLMLAMISDNQLIGGSPSATVTITNKPRDSSNQCLLGINVAKSGIIYRKRGELFELVKKALKPEKLGGTANLDIRRTALHCAADLVEALGPLADPYLGELINDMFTSGLSEDLISCLHAIAATVPSQQSVVEDRLLQEVSLCLAGTPNAADICDPLSGYHSTGGALKNAFSMSDRPETTSKVVLSLQTLGSFGDSDGMVAIEGIRLPILLFVRDVAAHYLQHQAIEVRRAAAITCCTLMIPFRLQESSDAGVRHHIQHAAMKRRLGSQSGRVVEEVLTRLLEVAVSDPSPIVRLCVVRALDERFDLFLCQVHHLQPLFFLLEDEALATRAAGLKLLGRLTRLNPAPILPFMRQFLVDLIIELRCGGDGGRVREEATRLLLVFLRAEPLHRLVQPVLPALVDALPLEGIAPRLVSVSLEALGELARASQTALKPWVDKIVPHILETMQDQSSASKQRTSLKTLGQIAGSTGYVIKPYLDYPQLLSQATDVMPGTKRAPWALRREVIRTLGIVGALDPDQYHNFVPKTRKGGAVGGGYFVASVIEGEPSSDTAGQGGTESGSKESVGGDSLAMTGSAKRLSLDAKTAMSLESKLLSTVVPSLRKHGREDDDDSPAHIFMYEQYAMVAQPVSRMLPPRRMTPSEDDFYPTVTIQALTRIFKDPSLAVHHGMVMQAIMFIFNYLGQKCVPFLDKVVPHMLYTIRTCGPSNLREALLKQVASLSGIVREHLSPYVAEIFKIVDEFWDSNHLGTILNLISRIAAGVPDDFRIYLPQLIRKLLTTLGEIQTSEWFLPQRHEMTGSSTLQLEKLELILNSIRSLKNVVGEYLHILVPALIKLADTLLSPSPSSRGTVISSTAFNHMVAVTFQTMSHLLQGEKSRSAGTGKSASICLGEMNTESLPPGCLLPARAAQPLIRFLGLESSSARPVGYAIVETICVCVRQMGRKRWKMYHHVARRAILGWDERVGGAESPALNSLEAVTEARSASPAGGLALYDLTVNEVESTPNAFTSLSIGIRHESFIDFPPSRISSEINFVEYSGGIDGLLDPSNPSIQPIFSQIRKHKANQGNLQRAWDVSQRASREDWDEWMRRFGIELLREAASPALRATASLAHAYQPLARELFSAAFVCCWEELDGQYRDNLVQALETAFVADASPEILQTLLNLAEFMEHDGVASGLPIDISNLAELALKCRAYAKALHYKEREYIQGGSRNGSACVASLISINKKLDLPEGGLGVLKTARLPQDGLLVGPLLRHDQIEEMKYSVVSSTDSVVSEERRSSDFDEIHESWLAKLGSWSEALTIYERKLGQNPYDFEAILGCMRCLYASGEWQAVLDLAEKNWPAVSGAACSESGYNNLSDHALSFRISPKSQRKLLKFSAEAAWRLGQWDELGKYASRLVHGELVHGKSAKVQPTVRIGQLGENMSVPALDFDGAFYSAVLYIHNQEWSLAADAIDDARKAMDSRFTALMAESYKRAYPSMVTAQTLAEMEEIIEFRKLEGRSIASGQRHPLNRPDMEEARSRLLSTWRERLSGCRFDSDVHAAIMAVRSLVLGPTDEVEATLTLSDLCRQAQRYKLAERVILDPLVDLGANLNGPVFGFGLPESLGLGLPRVENAADGKGIVDRLVSGNAENLLPQYTGIHEQCSRQLLQETGGLKRLHIQHQLYFAFVKHLWSMDQRDEALHRLENLCNVVDMIAHCERVSGDRLRVSCWIELGEYKLEETASPGALIGIHLQVKVLSAFKRAINVPECGYKAWHNWALLNFRVAEQIHKSNEAAPLHPGDPEAVKNHIIEAAKGFISAISLGTKRWSASVQQDLLNLLTCLFKYGDRHDVSTTINCGMDIITLEAWLGVLPQLLARIQIRNVAIRSVLHSLLTQLGEKHPQALMYPLSVLLKSPVAERKIASESLMTSLKAHSSSLVEEALMVSSELIRVAILWVETWHEGLEDASRLYFGEGNVSGMLEILIPLHEKLEKGAETQKEQEFEMSFGRDLEEAHAHVREYIRLVTANGGDIPTQGSPAVDGADGNPQTQQCVEAETAMNKAWDIYYQVFRWVNKQLPTLKKLELNQCSPALSHARNLELGVPGSYRVDGSYIKIESFIPSVNVITSKQRPRKITLRGNDGNDYVFLLKGHEDLRQDERVMQLFGLVNALLARDRQTKMYDLNIQRYAISPLSHNCGVVGWVPHCDTLHSLVRDYRVQKKVPLNMENREMLKISPDYDLLTTMQKVEVFTDALRRTTGNGNDLYEILWLKSTNSEEWLERRTKYARSLAVMSMVGYILGLGDRHPCNLMLDQLSGRVLHIDFGDCFEMAMNREKYPEKVPFRLTRMLIKAMEVSGIEGSYRSTCERTMTVLRDSRDSLVAMLEAFVYDPLISWRLAGLSGREVSSGGDTPDEATGMFASDLPSSNDTITNSVKEGGFRLSVLHESIAEGLNEEDDDGYEAKPKVCPLRSNTLLTGCSASLSERIHAGNTFENSSGGQDGGTSVARARSLQMFSSIKVLAANLSASYRIASVIGDGGNSQLHAAAEGSLSQSHFARSLRQREATIGNPGIAHEEALNEKALKVIRRVQDKLSGMDFPDVQLNNEPLAVTDQVQRLIVQATSSENLCQLFIGWCAFW